jgi:hypothetical protein
MLLLILSSALAVGLTVVFHCESCSWPGRRPSAGASKRCGT